MYSYKALPPLETVRKIRKILDDNGIKTTVRQFKYDNHLCSCRVIITNGRLASYNIGCNGKGITEEYALASGYAELMERLQNRIIGFEGQKYAVDFYQKNQLFDILPFQKKVGCPLNFFLFPDERIVHENCVRFNGLLSQIDPTLSIQKIEIPNALSSKKYFVAYVDMYNVTKKETALMPIELMRYLSDSTGMCSGNNPAEALIQGISEICERYILQLIYLRKAVFPLFNVDVLTESTKDLLDVLRHKGYEYKVYNCSLNGVFPVIGLLIINNNHGKYTYSFRLGSDIDPNTALTRCITEVFQGIDRMDEISLWDEQIDFLTQYEYHKSLINGSGRVPLDLFDANNVSDKYVDEINVNSRKEALLSLIEHFKFYGIEFWIRDNSYLDFPTYYVYSPQLSPVSNELRPNIPYIHYQSCLDIYYTLNPKYHICDDLSDVEVRYTYSLLERYTGQDLILYPYSKGHENNHNDSLVLLFSFKVSNELFDDALTLLNQIHKYLYIDGRYYETLKTALEMRIRGMEEQDIRSVIASMDDEDSISDILLDLFVRKHALLNYAHLGCDRLFIENSVYDDWINVQNILTNSFYSKRIDQSKLMDRIMLSD